MRRRYGLAVGLVMACGGQGDAPRPIDAHPAAAIGSAASPTRADAQAVAPWPERRTAGLAHVDNLVAKADHFRALQELALLYEVAQDDAEINRRLADSLYAEARYDEAEGVYVRLVEAGRAGAAGPRLAHDLARLSDLAGRKGEADRSQALLEEARRVDPQSAELRE